MRKPTGTAAIAMLIGTLGLLAVTPATAQFGIAVGANFTELDDIDVGDARMSFDRSTGWHAHVWLEVPLGPLAVRPGVRFMDMGALLEGATIDDVPNPADDENVRLIEVPLDLRIRLGNGPIRPYLLGGPVLRYNTTSDDADRFRSLSFAGGAGVGIEIGLAGLRLYPELKYTFGITRFTEETYELGGITVSPDEEQRLNAVMVSIGIGL